MLLIKRTPGSAIPTWATHVLTHKQTLGDFKPEYRYAFFTDGKYFELTSHKSNQLVPAVSHPYYDMTRFDVIAKIKAPTEHGSWGENGARREFTYDPYFLSVDRLDTFKFDADRMRRAIDKGAHEGFKSFIKHETSNPYESTKVEHGFEGMAETLNETLAKIRSKVSEENERLLSGSGEKKKPIGLLHHKKVRPSITDMVDSMEYMHHRELLLNQTGDLELEVMFSAVKKAGGTKAHTTTLIRSLFQSSTIINYGRTACRVESFKENCWFISMPSDSITINLKLVSSD